MKLNKSSLIVFGMFIVIQLLITFKPAEASSSSVEFIVDFSESMKELVGDKSKIDIAREVVSNIIDEIQEPQDVGLTLYGHRDKDKCDDIELVVPAKGLDKQTIKKKLMEAEPKGKAPIASALKTASERLKEDKNHKSIILITDGKMTCEGDLIKTAREIKEVYDFSVVFHVIALKPESGDRLQLILVSRIGYGTFQEIKNEKDIGDIGLAVKTIAEKINNPEVHDPKVVKNDDMVLIPAGEFLMGNKGGSSPSDVHTVYLNAFYIDRYEVTQRQYKETMGKNPSHWMGSDLPVENVTWSEAKEYCEKAGKRLPTEAEWEKAAKGGRNDLWAGTSNLENLVDYCWIDDTGAKQRTHPAGEKKSNGYGIYDMCGNVGEWTADWADLEYYKTGPKENPKGPDKGYQRIVRGGDWDNHQYEAHTSSRHSMYPDHKYGNIGFRCAKSSE